MIVKKKLKQVKCSICFKEKYHYYPMQSILSSIHFFFVPFSYIQLTITNYQKQHNENNNKDKISSTQQHKSIDLNSVLINPCKCQKAIHHQCLINKCLFFLSFQCEECNVFYSINFNPKRVKTISSIIIPLIILLILIIFGLIFIIKLILPKKYLFWNYVIGLLLLSIAIFQCSIIIYNQNRYKLIYNAVLAANYNNDNSNSSKSGCHSAGRLITYKKEYYDLMKDYCLKSYNMDYFELIEHKVNLNESLRLFKENDINEYIKQHNLKYKKLSECVNDEDTHDDYLLQRFGNHQIIKSSLVMSQSNSLISVENKKSKSNNASAQDSNKIKSVSKTPLLIIRETKEIIEDFSPVHNFECKKKISMNFFVLKNNNQHILDKQKDELITLSNNQ